MNLKESWSSFAFLVYTAFLFSCNSGSLTPTPVSYLGPRTFQPMPNDPRGKVLIEPEFLPLVQSFEFNRGKEIKTPIYFASDLPNSILGVCIMWKNDDTTVGEIKVNRTTFGRDSIESEMIIFHELGHCELGRPHSQDLTQLPDGRIVPFSLMYPVIFLSSDYSKNHEHYIIELFERGSILQKLGGDTLSEPEEIETIQSNGFEGYIYP